MSANKKNSNIIRLILVTLLGGVVGYTFSYVSRKQLLVSPNLIENLKLMFIQQLPIISILAALIILPVTIYFHSKARKLIKTKDIEEESIFQEIDKSIQISMLFNNILLIIFFSIVTLVMSSGNNAELKAYFSPVPLLLGICVLIISFILDIGNVNLTKQMNPIAKGDILSPTFEKDWINSIDEAEQQLMYRCGYKSWFLLKRCFMYGFFVLLFLSLFYEIGFLPIFMVAIFWAIHSVSYIVFSMKDTMNK